MVFSFRRGDRVTYQGKPYLWGSRSGEFRSLVLDLKNSSGPLVREEEVGESIFPGPDDRGAYDAKHAVVLQYDGQRLVAKVYVLRVGKREWIGAFDVACCHGRQGSVVLSVDSPRFASADAVLGHYLEHCVKTVDAFGIGEADARKETDYAIERLLAAVGRNVRDGVITAWAGGGARG